MGARYDYLSDPDAIYRQSFATIAAEVDLSRFTPQTRPIAERMIHACGQTGIASDLHISDNIVSAVLDAFAKGSRILVDVEMLTSAIIPRMLPEHVKVACYLNDPRAAQIGRARGVTRSMAALDLWHDELPGAVVVIGNAPTALFRLLEMLQDGAPAPAAIIATPVGFVGAAESKQALIDANLDIPIVTLTGRSGGTAMAGAAVNAIARQRP